MRKPTAGLTLLLACLMIFALAPAAAAQLLPTDPIGAIGDPLGGNTGGSGSDGGGSNGGSSGGGGVGDVIGGIGDPLGGDTSTSEPDGEPSKDPDPIKDTLDKVNDTVNSPEKTINETTEDPSGSVGGTVGGITNATEDGVNDISKGLAGKDGKDRTSSKNRKTTGGVTTGSGRFGTEAYRDKVFARALAAREADGKNHAPSILTSRTDSTTTAAAAGVIAQIGQVAAEAAEQAAFPLVLTLLVIAFLVGQNRIDSRDPKLALAPIDSDQDLLSFT